MDGSAGLSKPFIAYIPNRTVVYPPHTAMSSSSSSFSEPISTALPGMSASSVETVEMEDHARDADFNRAMHGETAKEPSHLLAMLKKDSNAQKVAADEYFKHWDNKGAANETEKDRRV